MLIGYVRVSTAEQNSARQEVLMRELGVEKVYLDKASGKNTNRPPAAGDADFRTAGRYHRGREHQPLCQKHPGSVGADGTAERQGHRVRQ